MSSPTSPTTPANNPANQPADEGPQLDLLTWLELNRVAILSSVAVVSIVVIALMVVKSRKHDAELAANTALLQLVPPTRTGDAATPASSTELLKFADEHAGNAAGARARLLAAGRLYSEGKYAEARAQFEKFEQDNSEGPFASIAALGVATALDAENKTNEAVTAYQRVIATYRDEPAAAHAKLNKARIQEALGQYKEALALYEELGKPPIRSMAQQSGMMARAQLLSAHPELDKPLVATNAINVVPPPVALPAPAK